MNPSPAKKGIVASNKSHPKRIPAHLSVSLRYDAAKPTAGQLDTPQRMITTPPKLSPNLESSDGSSGNNVQRWFNRANKHPKVAFSQHLEGSEEPSFLSSCLDKVADRRLPTYETPYFLPRISSHASHDMFQSTQRNLQEQDVSLGLFQQPSAHDGSSAGDFRSVIDDLTVENKRLREKLRKYEQAYAPELDKYKLFEVKMHSLPARKRRELESQLHAFASSLDQSSDVESPKDQPGDAKASTRVKTAQKPSLSSSASNSRPVDSAYASMSGPTSTSNQIHGVARKETGHQAREENDQDIESFLHNIPRGLLPKYPLVMNERQKKKLVVRRLEQLFTGRRGVDGGLHSQPLQQQEVSKSAAIADQKSTNSSSSLQGFREANMLPSEMETDSRPNWLARHSSSDTQNSRDAIDVSEGASPDDAENGQRPTRPLDLDPDRAQIPSENIQYIRHLGQSTPQLAKYDRTDAAADAQGWIYLNLLINMAQLHIINVTPDFVRHAVQDVSEHFQLSKDGNKIRWRGGCRPTQLSSSDSGLSSEKGSPKDSDGWDEGRGKRRKVDLGRFASIPVNIYRQTVVTGTSGRSKSMHYKPLFNHRNSSSEGLSSDDTESRMDYEGRRESRTGGTSHHRTWSERSRSRSRGNKRRRDAGPMVFYSGAQFCTDLCGDGDIQPPLHENDVGVDGFSNHTKDALGCASRPHFSRTESGSALKFRPFRDGTARMAERRSETPDLLESDLSDDEMSLAGPLDNPEIPKIFQAFDASGLGGTQPADHFAVQVETRRVRTFSSEASKSSRFSALGVGLRKIHATVSKPSLDVSSQFNILHSAESITQHLASLAAFSSPSPGSGSSVDMTTEDLPIQTEFLSTKLIHLEPSPLPAPLAYYSSSSTSEDGYESSCSSPAPSSSANISHLRGANITHTGFYLGKAHNSLTDPDTLHLNSKHGNTPGGFDDSEEGDEGSIDEEGSDDSDSEIDVLAYERQIDPESVRRKMDYEMERMDTSAASKPRSSVAAVAESESGSGSESESESGSESESDDADEEDDE